MFSTVVSFFATQIGGNSYLGNCYFHSRTVIHSVTENRSAQL